MEKTTILGVLLQNRTNTATTFQEVISRHGCKIKTRIGLHNVSNTSCSTDGVILLEVLGEDDEITSLIENIKTTIPNAQVQQMTFCAE